MLGCSFQCCDADDGHLKARTMGSELEVLTNSVFNKPSEYSQVSQRAASTSLTATKSQKQRGTECKQTVPGRRKTENGRAGRDTCTLRQLPKFATSGPQH